MGTGRGPRNECDEGRGTRDEGRSWAMGKAVLSDGTTAVWGPLSPPVPGGGLGGGGLLNPPAPSCKRLL